MSFFRNTYVYLFSNIVNAAIPFALLPILTRYLTPNEYGKIAMFQTILAGLSAFVGLNSVGAAGRRFYDCNISNTDMKEFNGTCIQVLIVSVLAISLITFIAAEHLCKYFSIPSEWLYLSIVISALAFFSNFRLSQWQVRGMAKKYGLLQITTSIINTSTTLVLVIVYKQGAEGRIDAILCANIISGLIGFLLLCKDDLIAIFHFDKNQMKDVLSFGVPLVPHVFGGFLLVSADRFVINDKLGLEQAGIYMVAVQLSMVLSIVFDAINKAYVPWLFEKLNADNPKEKLVIVKNTYAFFILIICIGVTSFYIGPLIVNSVVGEKYSSAATVIGLLCLGQIFGGMYLMVTNYVFYAKKTGMLSVVTIFTGLVNLIMMYCLVDFGGIQGVAIAFCLSKLLQFLLTWVLSGKVVDMPWFRCF